ncbi:type II toxin-antitoxin system RelE/ParE family toxin [Frigidibacter oleivorans]|uniref:type II toxin-antitoxin system RelE/ParE family toxin n=1 Tax=Frigidibacter oleivorans TaxID=2487129 RepID=UPI000F8E8B3E|nr:type II toxin-antitoxin system RelE/ParE family toxin [Frigidibacter oleivorans]
MPQVRVQRRAAAQIDEIFRYTRDRWGEDQARTYLEGLFDLFDRLAARTVASRPVPAEFGVDGFYIRYRRHVVYWRWLPDGAIGIVTILHERMHQMRHFDRDPP